MNEVIGPWPLSEAHESSNSHFGGEKVDVRGLDTGGGEAGVDLPMLLRDWLSLGVHALVWRTLVCFLRTW